VHNFVTYDDCEFEPGPMLNVILGPNGTGKVQIKLSFLLIKQNFFFSFFFKNQCRVPLFVLFVWDWVAQQMYVL
jgi:predicted ATPase